MNFYSEAWMAALFFAAAFCAILGIRDIRNKRYIWGTFAIVSAAVIIMTPLPMHSKINCPDALPQTK